MAKVTHNEVGCYPERDMAIGEVGFIRGVYVIRVSDGSIVDLVSGYILDMKMTGLRILRPDESITLRNE